MPRRVKDGTYLVALDERGAKTSSTGFSEWLQKRMNQGLKDIAFAIGGADGHGEALLSRADDRISLSPMTFPHNLVRLIFLEQLYRALSIIHNELYRALSIIHNEPYHNE